jgi:hypothetical protein
VLRFTRPALFTDDNANICLVFEEPGHNYFSLPNRNRLEKLAPLNPDQIKHVKRIHVLQESDDMGYIVCHASGCHLECLFSEVVGHLELSPMDFRWYQSYEDYSNDFFHVVADPTKIITWTSQIDWAFIKTTLGDSKSDKNRQDKHVGFGFTSAMFNSKDETVNKAAVSEPRLREGTFQPQVGKHFDVLTRFSLFPSLQWIEDLGLDIWEDPLHPDRNDEYTGRISDDNKIEGLYYGGSSMKPLF